jgi:hypothetical protein
MCPRPIHVLSYRLRAVTLMVLPSIHCPVWQIRRDAPTLIVNVPRGIEGGTFGGPVITTAGRLLGVVSWSGSADPEPADHESAEPADADQIGPDPASHRTAMAAPPHGMAVIRPGPLMAWSFRRSLRLGPFRLNLSKSGLGASVGVKGARVVWTGRARGTWPTAGGRDLLPGSACRRPRASHEGQASHPRDRRGAHGRPGDSGDAVNRNIAPAVTVVPRQQSGIVRAH